MNGQDLCDSGNAEQREAARDEHKFSHREGNVDDVIVTRGAWWPADHRGAPLVAMEDREADAIGLNVGDRLRFEILGQPVEAQLVAIYAQRRLQSRLWLEAIFSDGVLDPFVTRHVGAAWLAPDDAVRAQDRLAAAAPNIATVRTQALLDATNELMGRASAGLAVIALACLAASLLVLASVVAASRARHVYEASVMHALGARHASLRRVLRWRLELDPAGLYWTGALTAFGVSAASLGAGAQVLLAQMRVAPGRLLRAG